MTQDDPGDRGDESDARHQYARRRSQASGVLVVGVPYFQALQIFGPLLKVCVCECVDPDIRLFANATGAQQQAGLEGRRVQMRHLLSSVQKSTAPVATLVAKRGCSAM